MKHRMISTKFWSDGWVRKLNALDRYLFLYLLTNEHTTISGIYELPLDLMAIESGIDKGDLEKSMLDRLVPKIHYAADHVIIPNFPKHQNLKSPDVIKGILREFEELHPSLQQHVLSTGWGDGLGIAPDTKPNLTKPNSITAKAEEESEEVTIEPDEDTIPNKGFKKKAPDQNSRIIMEWAETEFKHRFPNPLKQMKSIKTMLSLGYTAEDIKKKWVELRDDPYWGEKGIDFGTVLVNIAKTQKTKEIFKSYT